MHQFFRNVLCVILAAIALSACRAERVAVASDEKLKRGVSSEQTEDMYVISYAKVSYIEDSDSAYVEVISSGNGMIMRDYGDRYTSARELYNTFYKAAFNTRGVVTVFRRPQGISDVINWACFDCTQLPLK